jgi:hypothetical protein
MKFLIIIFFLCNPAHALENVWSLKGGIGVDFQTLKGENLSNDNIFGFSINSSFGYRFTDFSISAASYLSIGHTDNLIFKVEEDTHGYAESLYGSFNLLLLFKYYTPKDFFKKYQLYFSLGPGISLQTFWPEEDSAYEGFISGSEKLSLETFGVFGTIGIEERVIFKEEYPKFFEILWGFNNAYKADLVNIQDEKTTTIVKTDENNYNFKNFLIILSFGITFF